MNKQSPDHTAFTTQADILMKKGQFEEAACLYRNALKHAPDNPAIYIKLGDAIAKSNNPDLIVAALACYKKALAIYPDNPIAHNKTGKIFYRLGKWDDAILSHKKAIKIDPGFAKARFDLAISQLPVIYKNDEHIASARSCYHNELKHLMKSITLDDADSINKAAEAIGDYPFYLAYQGHNDRELQQMYGELISKIQAKKYPKWTKKIALTPPKNGEAIRVGIVSGFFRLHSNWKIPIKGWVENLDKQAFALYAYHTGTIEDSQTKIAQRSFARFVNCNDSFEKICAGILKDKLHILIYPEVGMNPMALKLSALRLAPIQCASWGHPSTTGLPTIDYFISSSLMEPQGAEKHYSEKLVKLPNLSIHYTPINIKPAPVDRSALGLRPGTVLYLCAQSIYKYLPQYDGVFPRIAEKVKNSQFAFLLHRDPHHLTKQFKHRLTQAFARYNLRSEDYVVYLPHLDPRRYHALNRMADVFLDTIGWSGCNTTMEAIACNLPIVTLPGKLMRARHSYAILTMMGIKDTIASTLNGYIDIAVKLGNDSNRRDKMATGIANNKHKIYRDMEAIKGLETFLKDVVKEM